MAAVITVGQIQAIAALKDTLTPGLKGIKGQFQAAARVGTAAFGAISVLALKAGADHDKARAIIAEGTGATGEALKRLQGQWVDLAGTIPGVAGPAVATALADLNTHLGLQGEELEAVSAKALKAGVDTNIYGGLAKQMGLDAQGAGELLDVLTAAQQKTGVSQDELASRTAKMSARWLEAGGDMEGLLATVVQAADDFGPAGLRGALSEIGTEVDKGIIPAFRSLDEQLGDVGGTVERTHADRVTFAEQMVAWKDRALALVGPFGNVAGGVGSAVTAMLGMASTPGIMTAVAGAARFMWAAVTGPVGLVIAGVAALIAIWAKWGDEIKGFLKGVWNKFVGALEKGLNWLRPLAAKFGVELPAGLENFKASLEVAEEKMEDAEDAGEVLGETLVEVSEATDAATVSTQELADTMPTLTDLLGRSRRAAEEYRDRVLDSMIAVPIRIRESPQWLTLPNELSREIVQNPAWGGLSHDIPELIFDEGQFKGAAIQNAMDAARGAAVENATRWADGISHAMFEVSHLQDALHAGFGSPEMGATLDAAGRSIGFAIGGPAGAELGSAIANAVNTVLPKVLSAIQSVLGAITGGRYGVAETQRRYPGAGQGGGSGISSVSGGLEDIPGQAQGGTGGASPQLPFVGPVTFGGGGGGGNKLQIVAVLEVDGRRMAEKVIEEVPGIASERGFGDG